MQNGTFTDIFFSSQTAGMFAWRAFFLWGSCWVQGIIDFLILLPFTVSCACFLSSLRLFTPFYRSCRVALSAASFLLVFLFFLLLLTYIRCPIFAFSIPSPSLNSSLPSVIACAIFVEFAPTLLIPWLGLSINFQVSPWWPFTRTPCHGWRSYRRHVFSLHQVFQKKKRREVKVSRWCDEQLERGEGGKKKALRGGTGSISESPNHSSS